MEMDGINFTNWWTTIGVNINRESNTPWVIKDIQTSTHSIKRLTIWKDQNSTRLERPRNSAYRLHPWEKPRNGLNKLGGLSGFVVFIGVSLSGAQRG